MGDGYSNQPNNAKRSNMMMRTTFDHEKVLGEVPNLKNSIRHKNKQTNFMKENPPPTGEELKTNQDEKKQAPSGETVAPLNASSGAPPSASSGAPPSASNASSQPVAMTPPAPSGNP